MNVNHLRPKSRSHEVSGSFDTKFSGKRTELCNLFNVTAYRKTEHIYFDWKQHYIIIPQNSEVMAGRKYSF